jgi:hypothetical protein
MDHEVVLFSYDWRRDNAETAQELENFIAEKQYTDVILIAHSMGGLVCSSYLSKEENRQRTSKFIPVAVPFLGSVETSPMMLEGQLSTYTLDEIFAFAIRSTLNDAGNNLHSIYELLPPKQYFETQGQGYLETYEPYYIFWKQNERSIDSYEETIETLKQILYNPHDDALLQKAQKFHDSLRDKAGNMLAFKGPTKVYNIAGYGLDTASKVALKYKNGNFIKTDEELKSDGDGAVSLISAISNNPTPNTYYVKGIKHTSIISDKDVIDLIINIIRDEPQTYSPDHISQEVPT